MKIPRILPFLALLFWIGCAAAPRPAENNILSSDDILVRLTRHDGPLRSFAADGSITVTTPTMEQTVGFELASRGQDSVKMSVFGPFGITVGTALFTRSEFTAYNALNNTVYRGSPERQLKLLPFINDIPFELFMGTLQGVHLLRSVTAVESLQSRPGNTYSFSVAYANGSYDAVLYNSETDRITRCTRHQEDGSTVWSLRYFYQRSDSGDVVPEQVEVSIPAKGSILLIEYGSIAAVSDSADFSIEYPDDAEIITIE